jgi:ABC-type multidrug transport system fused ATPase/permease subunit
MIHTGHVNKIAKFGPGPGKSGQIYLKLWRLLGRFHQDYYRFLAGVVLRQALVVFGGYLILWALQLSQRHVGIPEWAFIVTFILFDAGFLSFDCGLNFLFASRVSYPMFAHLRTSALRKVFDMPLEWHHRQNSGTLVGEVNTGVGKVVQTAEGLSRELCPALVRTGFSLIPLLLFCPVATPALVGALGIFLWLTALENRDRDSFRVARYRNYARDFGFFSECVQSFQPVVQFGQSRRLLRQYGQVQDQIMFEGVSETRIGNRFGWWKSMVLSVTKRISQGIWLWQYRRGVLDAPTVMYLNMLTEELLASFWGYAGLLERIYDGLEPTRILVQLLREKPALLDNGAAAPVAVPSQVGIRMVDVGFTYSRGNKVIRNLNLSIKQGKITGLVGRSGCGKTTIHSLLSRMFDIQQGSILVCGEDVRKWPVEQLRGLFSFVSQSGGVFFSDTTLLDVIRFARPDAVTADVVKAAQLACIHDEIDRLPQKYETKIGQGGVTLSKGQQQRIALAQALIALDDRRKVLVLDEFTSQLDSETERQILNNIMPLLAGRTVIIVAHRLSTLRHIADNIVVLDEGGVVEQGSHEQLVERGGWYAAMAKLQAVA